MTELRSRLEEEMARVRPSSITVESVWRRRRRRGRNRRLAAGFVAVAVFAAPMGWLGMTLRDGGPIPAAQPDVRSIEQAFIAQASRACAEKQAKLDALDLGPEGTDEYSRKAIRDMRRAQPVYSHFVEELESFALPPGDEQAADLVIAWRRVARKAREAAAAGDRGREREFETAARDFWPLLDLAHNQSVAYGIC
jgi:hypothetical protein